LLITTVAGLLSLVLALFLVPRFADFGMSIAVVATEFMVSLVLVCLQWRDGVFPYHPNARYHFSSNPERDMIGALNTIQPTRSH
jgi:O-antigen/teichoic acid export membrane protein